MERTVTAAFTVKWLWLGMGHCNARFFGSAAGVASGLFPVGVAAGRCYSAKQLRGQYSSSSRIVVLARSVSVMIQKSDGGRDAVRGEDTSAIMDSGTVRLDIFSRQV